MLSIRALRADYHCCLPALLKEPTANAQPIYLFLHHRSWDRVIFTELQLFLLVFYVCNHDAEEPDLKPRAAEAKVWAVTTSSAAAVDFDRAQESVLR